MTFPFTQTKFLSLGPKNRHQWIIRWLSEQYQHLLTNRMSPRGRDLMFTTYCRVLGWMNHPLPQAPEPHDDRAWRAFISDAVNAHRLATGIRPRDPDLLLEVDYGDRNTTGPFVPCFDYHLALDGFRSLFNVGSVFRICDSAGFRSVILGNIPDSSNPVVMKTSMGSAAWVPQSRTHDLAGTLLDMKSSGYTAIGLETVRSSTPYLDFDWPLRGIIVLGNEEYGLSSHVLGVCDAIVHIPMFGKKNSINVACAASVIALHVATALDKKGLRESGPGSENRQTYGFEESMFPGGKDIRHP
ncbi:MAG: TrmH family RNA methyltransferase [Pseudomonadota bacterium]